MQHFCGIIKGEETNFEEKMIRLALPTQFSSYLGYQGLNETGAVRMPVLGHLAIAQVWKEGRKEGRYYKLLLNRHCLLTKLIFDQWLVQAPRYIRAFLAFFRI